MKKNNIFPYLVLLFMVSGGLYLYTASSRTIDALQKGIAERDALIAGRDNTIAGLRVEITDLRSAKSDLAKKLDGETLAKAAISENLNTLERQFGDATRENIRVKGRLTEALNKAKVDLNKAKVDLNKAKVDLNKAKVEAEGLKASKKFLISQYQEVQHRETEIRLDTVKMYQFALGSLEYEREKNEKLKLVVSTMEGRLEIAKKLVKSALVQETRPVAIKTSKVVKVAIFVSADIKLSIADIDRYRVAVGRSVKLNQLWFFSQLGETFSAEEPIMVFLGKKKLAEYDKLSAGERIIEIRKEMNVPWEETFIIFLLGGKDSSSYGANFPPTALISGYVTNQILEGYDAGKAVIAHELGHVWGLPHLISDDKTAIMMVLSDGTAPALHFFPFMKFTELEKKEVTRNLKLK